MADSINWIGSNSGWAIIISAIIAALIALFGKYWLKRKGFREKEEGRRIEYIPRRVGKFVGREEELLKIENIFSRHNSTTITQTVKGSGGIGKTMLALEYAKQFAKKNPKADVYWFDAEDSNKIEQSVKRFLRDIEWKLQKPNMFLSDELRSWYIATRRHFLLVFDNVESFDAIRKYLPDNDLKQGYVLLTTRKGKGFPNPVDLKKFSPEEARDYLDKNFYMDHTVADADALGIRLGHFPLALSQAAAYMRQEKLTISSYLELIGDSTPQFVTDGDYERLMQEIWETTTEKILTHDAKLMLRLCAYLSADNLPIEKYAESPFKFIFTTEDVFDKSLEELRNYSLIEDDNSIHRVMQDILREKDGDAGDKKKPLLARAIGMMKDALLRAMEDDDLFIELSPHASAAAFHTLNHVFPGGKAPLDLESLSSMSAYDDRSKVDGNFKWTLLWIVAQLEKMLDAKNGAYKKLFGCEMLRNEDGSIRLFGGFEWEVLKYSEDRKRALIVTREIVGRRPYDGVTEEEWDDDSYKGVTWEECSLRAWLNSGKTPQRKDGRTFDYTSEDPNDEERSGFLNRFFSADERAKIADVNLPNPSMIYTALDGSPRDPTPGGEETRDKVFLFSIDELLDVFGVRRGENEDVIEAVKRCESDIRVIDTDPKWFTEYKESWDSWLQKQTLWSEKLIAIEDVKGSDKSNKNDEKNTWWWWLRSPGSNPDYAAYVSRVGNVYLDGDNVFRGEGGVRPALWLNL